MDVSLSLNIYKGALNIATLAQINIQKTALIFTFDLANDFFYITYSTLTASTVDQVIHRHTWKANKQMTFHCIYCLHVLVRFKSCSFFMKWFPTPFLEQIPSKILLLAKWAVLLLMLFVETSSSIYCLHVWLQKPVVYIHIPSRWLRETDFNISLKILSRNWEVKERGRTS